MKVPLHFVREAESPAVKLQGALISHVANDVDVSCLPKDLPEFIEVDLSALESGKSIHVSELKLPEGVVAVTHGKDSVVAIAAIPKAHVEVEEEAAATAEGAAAPAPAAAEAKPAEAAKGAEKKEGGKDEKKK
jgi:large subunit ribosomal protein L25